MLSNSLKGYGPWLVERGELRGEQKGKLEAAKNALKMGVTIQQTAQITGIPEDALLNQLNKPQQ